MRLEELMLYPTFTISSDIGPYILKELVTWLGSLSDYEATIIINSDGGRVCDMLGMYDLIRTHEGINMVALGSCRSAAVTLMAATDVRRRYSAPNTRFMTHPVNYHRNGISVECQPYRMSEEELRALDGPSQVDVRETLAVQERLIEILADRTRLRPADARELFSKVRHFWPERALEYGIIGQILDPVIVDPAQGCLW